eukprot:4905244-Pleurochrysis_carterae.AAC.1
MTLMRVFNGIFMQHASKEDITFGTLEYSYTPHPSLPHGRWGTFASLKNAAYSATDAKSGS